MEEAFMEAPVVVLILEHALFVAAMLLTAMNAVWFWTLSRYHQSLNDWTDYVAEKEGWEWWKQRHR
jgi:hypothetical protein